MEKQLLELIEIAIGKEEEAHHFYLDLSKKILDEPTRDAILWIADEEAKHKKFLIDYRDGRLGTDKLRINEITYYKIAEHQKEPEAAPDIKREDVFLLAAHRELKAFQFYTELAELHPGGIAKEMLLRMASEEMKHKEKMEYLYTNAAFPQTDGG
ncbi:MAG: ferritin family protein [Thermodesulfobacteriota bacterium]